MFLPREDQFTGCLIGQALGDALGFPVEGLAPDLTERYVLAFLQTGHAGELAASPFPFGQYSDDTQLARELLQSCVTVGGFEPADYAARIAAIFADDRIVGRGRATEAAAQRLIAGVPWERSGAPPPAAGNGSAMRAAPIGLFFYDEPDRLIQAASDQSWITHRDPRCAAGAVAIAGAVALGLRPEPIEPAIFLEQLADWSGRIEPTLAAGLIKLTGWLDRPPAAVRDSIQATGDNPDYAGWTNGISPFVTSSVLWSLYSFLRTPNDYWATICTAIAVGGDVDTTAAMAGAIAGAHLGLDALPEHLAARLTDRGDWDYSELIDLARLAHTVKVGA